MTKHAFVTGATGFLGVNFISTLIKDGWNVTAIHRSKVDHPLLNDVQVNWRKGSLHDLDSLQAALPSEPFHAFHLAASTVQWKPQFDQQRLTNVLGTKNMLSALNGSKVERLIHTSSITTFGIHEETISEKSEQRGLTCGVNYGVTKFEAEELVRKAVKNGEIDAVILNPCHIIGPWDTHNWIELFKHAKNGTLPGIPPASGNFAWVEEVAKAHISAVKNGKSGENYILGGPYASLLELVNEMQRQLNKKVSKSAVSPNLLQAIEPIYRLQSFFTRKEPTLTPDKVRLLIKSFQADDRKARLELNYQHKTISEIVAQTLKWLNQHGD